MPAQAVVARLSMLPKGAEAYGTSTAGCSGPLTIGVMSMPRVGNARFAFTCGAAPRAGTAGWLAVSTAPLAVPVSVGGAGLWVDPAEILALVPLVSQQPAYAEIPVRIPGDPGLAGVQVSVQFLWENPAAPPAYMASNALTITVQE